MWHLSSFANAIECRKKAGKILTQYNHHIIAVPVKNQHMLKIDNTLFKNWGLDKITFCKRHFSNQFSQTRVLIRILRNFVRKGSNWQQVSIGSGNASIMNQFICAPPSLYMLNQHLYLCSLCNIALSLNIFITALMLKLSKLKEMLPEGFL